MTRRWALLAALASAGAVWPRVELPGAWLHAVHVPKAGGTTLDRALMRVHCFLGGDEADDESLQFDDGKFVSGNMPGTVVGFKVSNKELCESVGRYGTGRKPKCMNRSLLP